jgi:hypothetical protein
MLSNTNTKTDTFAFVDDFIVGKKKMLLVVSKL